jgi:hypothetical protein
LDPDSNPGFESGFESGSETGSGSETNFMPDPDPKLDPKLLFRIRNTDFKLHLTQGDVCFFPSPFAVSNCAHLLSACCKEESGVLYSEAETIKGRRN